MARIRTLKPEFFRSRSLAKVSIPARLTFQGLWCEADDAGNGIADPRILAGSLWPLDDDMDWPEVERHLRELVDSAHIVLYEVEGERYFSICKWEQHQAAAYRRGVPQHPAPPATPSDTTVHGDECNNVHDAQPGVLEGIGREGNVLASAPPTAQADARAGRPADQTWDTVLDVCGLTGVTPTPSARGAWNKAVKGIRATGAPPDEIRRRAAAYRQKWPDVSLTPTALERHWDEVVALGASVQPIRPPLPTDHDDQVLARMALSILPPERRNQLGEELLMQGALACLEQNADVELEDLATAAVAYAEARPPEPAR